MTINSTVNNVTNFLVPAGGTTHAVGFSGQFSSTPFPIDWRQFKIDQFPFQPQGVYIDNRAGTVDLTITVLPLGFAVICPAGGTRAASFPAPNGQTATITGDPTNTASVVFVDYPVFDDNPNATLTLKALAAGGLPLRTQEMASTAEVVQGTIAAGSTTLTRTPATANQNLRKAVIHLSGDATLAAAGHITVSLTANGAPVFSRDIFIPTVAGSTPGYALAELDFTAIGVGLSAGNIVLSLSGALATGVVSFNGYLTAQ